ncbi:MAG: N-6 DNA methylase [Planctomycetaceae bacterium]|jgi:adenine-specific DNA-methyltransferase|nr:N-6 DNA methylase [Planctomycetaceae bacterium]
MTTANDTLQRLVIQFRANLAQYKSVNYDEANTPVDFIDKFFELLGWDIANKQGFSESYRDVVREDKVKIDGVQKAPDYSFRIGGNRKFFVEAKKPIVNVHDEIAPAFQIRRYGYSAKLALSILTDFEEFAIYDTRIKPDKNDKPIAARIFYCKFDEYLEKCRYDGFETNFDYIASIFSKDAILKGSFDRYIESNKNKKGTSEVDKEILALIESWRIELAKNIAKNNPDLSIYNLNTVVQKIIDRIIFLRIAEDKGIEDEALLLTVAKTNGIYEKLIVLFERANAKYNSGLFTRVDWIDNARVDDKTLAQIIVNLYYPECPYEFSVLPIEILGSIYERFLGKTICFTAGHNAKIEEKPEVKKAGGVFYTPQYIVEYIVQNTAGEKIKGKTPDEISLITICDPACGSGAFLVGAYQFLLNAHLDYYTQQKNLKAAIKGEKIYESAHQTYKLTIAEKQRILVNNIFGVDIDQQAVEVTKLSLYLKLLENEGKEAAGQLFKYSDMRLLPSLENNIKCGNSLIGTDFYAQDNFDFTDEERFKVNCFDWEKEFPAIFKRGGFDCVIGNPPWEIVIGKEYKQDIQPLTLLNDYYKRHYTVIQGETNLYRLFAERIANTLLSTHGRWGYIMPSSTLNDRSASNLRKLLLDAFRYIEVNHFPEKARVFNQVTQDVCIYCFANDKSQIRLRTGLIGVEGYQKKFITLPKKLVQKLDKIPFCQSKQESNLLLKLSDYETFDEKNVIKFLEGEIHLTKYKAAILPRKTSKSVFSLIRGDAVQRYTLQQSGKDSFLDERAAKSISDVPKLMDCDKIRLVYQQIVNIQKERRLNFYLLGKEIYVANTCGYALVIDSKFDIRFFLGLLNSKLLNWRYKQTSSNNHILTNELQKLPIPSLDLSNKSDKDKHDRLVSLVDKILELKRQEVLEVSTELKTMISRQIAGVDTAIDTAVYELYGLTDEEIKVVEGE